VTSDQCSVGQKDKEEPQASSRKAGPQSAHKQVYSVRLLRNRNWGLGIGKLKRYDEIAALRSQ